MSMNDLAQQPGETDQDYTVRLDRVFSGPMDLLLHLVREQEVEIHEVEIHRVVSDYLSYLRAITELDIEAAADFLLMAATLMAIKSRSLLPTDELDLEEELDPRDELIQRLIEYRRFRTCAEDLEFRFEQRALIVPRGWRGEVAGNRAEPMLDLGDLTAFDLLTQWSRLLREVSAARVHHVHSDPRPIRFYVDRLVEQLKAGGRLSIRGLMEKGAIDGPKREVLIGSFCAVLELAKVGLLQVDQDQFGADIELELHPGSLDRLDEVLAETNFEEFDTQNLEDAEELADRELVLESKPEEDGPREDGPREDGPEEQAGA